MFLDANNLDPVAEFKALTAFNPADVESSCGLLGIVGKFAACYEGIAYPPPSPPSDS